MKTIASIDTLIEEKKAKVFTAAEIKEMVKDGRIPSVDDVDIVTTGTFGVMSGTMAILTVPVAEPGTFVKAETITMNGVPAFPGPCPNESLGIVDCVVYGTSKRDHQYGGGHLFKDIVDENVIDVKVTSDGKSFSKKITIKDIPFARMIVTRSAFRNYVSFLNPAENNFKTIFSVTGMKGPLKEVSVSGCGEINPLQNDSGYMKEGTSVLVNGSHGIVIGNGTRSSTTRPNISAAADMRGMDGNMMGGFVTSTGPECLTSIAAAIPITDKISLRNICVLDKDIELPIADIQTRVPKHSTDYSKVWSGTDRKITVDEENCLHCPYCPAQDLCPVGAIEPAHIDETKCVVCGSCLKTCIGKIFTANLGSIDYNGTDVPITLRQSDRNRAETLSEKLKTIVSEGNWKLRCG